MILLTPYPAAWVLALALLVALVVDRWLGEPPVRLHPVVWLGHYLGYVGAWVQRRTVQQPGVKDFKAFWLSALAWTAGAAIFSGVFCALQSALLSLPWWGAGVLLGLLLKPLLAWAMLKSEVQAVEAALAESLEAGRERLRWLVSRDTAQLTATEVRESAIETLAENLNDSVVAPLFWFVLLGLPGAALYRFANTADAMWGYPGLYKGQNWEWAGKWAARADDALSYIPARLTGMTLLALASLQSTRSTPSEATHPMPERQANAVGVRWRDLAREAVKTPSPNSGWPMAAMALALGVGLRKPGVYVLNPPGRAAVAADTSGAIVYTSNTLIALVLLAQIALLFIAFMMHA
ncbi:MAG: adenosylcobinamide-phosphate synthase CbiB [Rhodoferax sp.]|nr:adenosylcobinamide-phosphate synthase CbiB [Rhodoferax sp.]